MKNAAPMKRYAGHVGNTPFDVIVIGGGISGAAIAYEAATRGLRVVLFEKGDFSEATSAAISRSHLSLNGRGLGRNPGIGTGLHLKALKNHFDPHNIMNPGDQLGLDLDPTQTRKT